MRIMTTEFSLTKKEYFRIKFFSLLKSYWFVFLIIFLICFLGTTLEIVSVVSHIVLGIMAAGIFLGYLAIVCLKQSLFLKRNQLHLLSRTCGIDHEFVSVQFSGGSVLKVSFAQILKIVMTKNYCLFYFADHDFIYLPFNSFTNPADLQMLMTFLKVKSG